ncbi:hypothetical protein BMS3Abin03_00574 [bacterium BMS3Abin03]|nr:hypothetical protein BMS3Abin03_00574 [bacterium BMS3Abin03]
MGKKNISSYTALLQKDEESFLEFLKAKFPVFYNSNFFYRDLEYGIRSFLEKKNIFITYGEADKLAQLMGKYFEKKGIFIKVSKTGWKVNYPEFATTEPGDPF